MKGEGFPARQLWEIKAIPRVAFFTWEAAKECILILDKLTRRSKILVNGCYSCKRDAESLITSHCGILSHLGFGVWLMDYWG